jgi:tRNA threonylcarbamoyladenosine biosynthesis protein TsaE
LKKCLYQFLSLMQSETIIYNMARFYIDTIAAIQAVAGDFLKKYPDHRIFAFYGELGSGKTTFIKALCRKLGVTDLVSSPSFALIHEYQSSRSAKLYHFDFYRMEKLEEAYDIGYEDYFYSGHYCFIEWADKAEPLLPSGTLHVNIIVTESSGRILEIRE